LKKVFSKRSSKSKLKKMYTQYYTSLCLFSNKYVKELDLSKDIVQEVFIKIWKKQVVFESELALKSYLYTATKNKCLDYLKSKKYKKDRELSSLELALLTSDSYFKKEVLLEEVSRTVRQAVDTLPFKCKEIISLSLNGLKNEQIDEELDVSINTVKTQKRIAYKKLRPILKNIYLIVFFLI